jgi:hypothetical protein
LLGGYVATSLMGGTVRAAIQWSYFCIVETFWWTWAIPIKYFFITSCPKKYHATRHIEFLLPGPIQKLRETIYKTQTQTQNPKNNVNNKTKKHRTIAQNVYKRFAQLIMDQYQQASHQILQSLQLEINESNQTKTPQFLLILNEFPNMPQFEFELQKISIPEYQFPSMKSLIDRLGWQTIAIQMNFYANNSNTIATPIIKQQQQTSVNINFSNSNQLNSRKFQHFIIPKPWQTTMRQRRPIRNFNFTNNSNNNTNHKSEAVSSENVSQAGNTVPKVEPTMYSNLASILPTMPAMPT